MFYCQYNQSRFNRYTIKEKVHLKEDNRPAKTRRPVVAASRKRHETTTQIDNDTHEQTHDCVKKADEETEDDAKEATKDVNDNVKDETDEVSEQGTESQEDQYFVSQKMGIERTREP